MPKVSDIYTELKIDLSSFKAGIASASTQASTLGSSLSQAIGSDLTASIKQADSAMSSFTNNASSSLKDLGRIVQGILISQAFYTLVRTLKDAAGAVYEFKKSTEQAEIAFAYLTGSGENSIKMLRQLEDFAAVTPFELDNVRDYARQLMAAGFTTEEVIPTLRKLSDTMAVAGGDPEVFKRVTGALAKMKAQGKVTAKQINSIALAGIPIYDILRQEMGLTSDELAEIGKLGISADEGINAILNGLQKRYAGASAAMEKTTEGLMSTIKDNFTLVLGDAVDAMYNKFRGFITKVADFASELREITRSEGLEGAFKFVIPENLQEPLRVVISELQALFGILRDLAPIAGLALEPLARIAASLAPVVYAVANAIHMVAQAAANGNVFVRFLVGAISGLFIAGKIAGLLSGFIGVIKKLWVAQVAAKAVKGLAGAIKLVSIALTANPIGALVAVVAGALLALVLSSDAAARALDGLMQRLAKLFGVDLASMFDPVDPSDYTGAMDDIGGALEGVGDAAEDAGDGMGDAGDAMDDAGGKADKAKKKLKDLLFAFDEVYRITKDDGSDGGGGGGGKGDGGGAGGAGDFGGIKLPGGSSSNPAKDLGESIKDQLERMGPIMLPGFAWPPLPPLPQFEYTLEPWFDGIRQRFADFALELPLVFAGAFNLAPALVPQLEAAGATVGTWLQEQYANMKNWAGQTTGAVQQWGYNTGLVISQWVAETSAAFNKWRETNNLGAWSTESASAVMSFVSSTAGALAGWATANNLKGWATDAINNVKDFATNAGNAIRDWTTSSSTTIQGWSTAAIATLAGWAASGVQTVSNWATNTGNTIAGWTTQTIGSISTWASQTAGNIATWVSETVGKIRGWSVDTGVTIGTWVGQTAAQLGGWSVTAAGHIATWASNAWESVKTWAVNTGTTILDWIKETADKLDLSGGMAMVRKAWEGVWNFFLGFLKDFALHALAVLGGFVIGIIGKFLGPKAATFASTVAAFFAPVTTFAEENADNANEEMDGIPTHTATLYDKMRDAADRMAQGFKDAWQNAVDWVKEKLDALAGSSSGGVSIGDTGPWGKGAVGTGRSMNHMANGGMVSRNQFIEIGERNRRETVVPLENQSALAPVYAHIDQAVQSAMEGYQGSVNVGGDTGSMRPLYVGTLIADERSLRELQQKMHIIEVEEAKRRGM